MTTTDLVIFSAAGADNLFAQSTQGSKTSYIDLICTINYPMPISACNMLCRRRMRAFWGGVSLTDRMGDRGQIVPGSAIA